MSYIQTHEDGSYSANIPEGIPIYWDSQNFCTVEALVFDGKAEQFRVYPLTTVSAPSHDAMTQGVRALDPAVVDGAWTQQWEVVDLSPEQIAANQAAAATAMIQACDKALTDHLDATAKNRRYDNRITCAVRAGYPGPFQSEGVAFALWMDTCNALAYQFLAEIQAGTRPLPTDPQQLIAELPAMEWPQ